MLSDPNEWRERAGDISFVIDSLPTLGERTPQLTGKLDADSVGVTGHSYGAFTAQLIGGVTIDIPEGERDVSFADPRASAVLLFSPQGRDQFGQTERSWRAMKVPAMSVTGSRDRGTRGQGLDWLMDTYNLSPPGNKFCVLIEDASHLSFSSRLMRKIEQEEEREARSLNNDESGPEPPSSVEQRAIYQYVKLASLTFWDAYLKDEPKAREYLASQRLPELSGGRVKLMRK